MDDEDLLTEKNTEEFFDCEDDDISDQDDIEDQFYDCLEFESFDLDVQAEFQLPFTVGPPADKVCLLSNKLISKGLLSTESFFYKNIKAVAEHLEHPKTEWDNEVCEALQSIQHAGGGVAVSYVVGPLGHHGPLGVPLLNYGGPSYQTLKRRKPGTMPVSGITKQLLISALKLLELSDVKTSTATSLLFPVGLQVDGTMLKAGGNIFIFLSVFVFVYIC